jgi:hypothetical protein
VQAPTVNGLVLVPGGDNQPKIEIFRVKGTLDIQAKTWQELWEHANSQPR